MKAWALLLTIVLAGCATAYQLSTRRDDFNQYNQWRMENNLLAGAGFLSSANMYLGATKTTWDSGETQYLLAVTYRADNWLFIEDGNSLRLIIDGEQVEYSGDGSSAYRNVLSGGRIHERAFYKVTPAQIRRIAEALEIRVRLEGNQFYAERIFSPLNIERFRAFVQQYLRKRRPDGCESANVKAWPEWIGSPPRNVNIRIGPGINYPLHESGGLLAGEEIQILQDCQGWLQARAMPEHLIDRAIELHGLARAQEMLLFWVRKDLIRRQAEPAIVAPRPAPARRCCRICTRGKACGNSCIARNLTCRQPPGCACNGEQGQGDSCPRQT